MGGLAQSRGQLVGGRLPPDRRHQTSFSRLSLSQPLPALLALAFIFSFLPLISACRYVTCTLTFDCRNNLNPPLRV